jgi:hypothetical protein
MSTHATSTTTDPALPRARRELLELRALIAVALADLVALVPRVRRFIAHPEDTHQATGSFLTVEARAYMDDLVRSERLDRHRNLLEGIKVTGEVPAPVGVAASSIVAETETYLADAVHRLTTKLHAAGVCALVEHENHSTTLEARGSVDELAVRLRGLVDMVGNPTRLIPIHRTLEDLVTRARRAAEGPDTAALPDPCPHCGRMSLLVHLSAGITRCERDTTSSQRHPCRCTEPYCPCTRDRDYRHEWSRAAKAHTSTSWQGLRRAQKDAVMNAEAIERIRALHQPYWRDNDGQAHTHRVLVPAADVPAGHTCVDDGLDRCDGPLDDPESEHAVPACVECQWASDETTGYQFFPCRTIRSLDGPLEAKRSES